MIIASDPRHPDAPTGGYPAAAGFPPAMLETVAGSMMRVAEAGFVLLQAIMQAQFGMVEAMMQAGSVTLPHGPAGRAAPPAGRHEPAKPAA